MKFFWIIITLLSGAFLPVQAGLNSWLGKSLHNPVYASMLSFIIGAITVILYILLTRQEVVWEGVKKAPGYVWMGGVLGAFYVTAIILAFPRIGPALTFGLVVAGQMVIAILLDHFNILVAQQHTITIWRILEVVLIVAGVILIRKF
ncbi:DMT family transporter [Rhodocytophaga aerolata]|uniref:DMT family transporter n=1 Tax=Rhodocytophaga aerolata TaxID=455078 RepID=A0ABT8RET8_9BACT|nr:DMT family transporter [Rhodocytophaga aerolata]MDO1449698.1 DMT family transporter [Rhodocytophaga aerolata]